MVREAALGRRGWAPTPTPDTDDAIADDAAVYQGPRPKPRHYWFPDANTKPDATRTDDDAGLAAAMMRMGFDGDGDLKMDGSSGVEGGSSGKGYTGKPGSAPPDAPSEVPDDAPSETPSEAPSKAKRRNMRRMAAKAKASELQQGTLDEYNRLQVARCAVRHLVVKGTDRWRYRVH